MKITIVGGGKVGYTIAEQLTGEDHDITLIERDSTVADNISGSIDIMTICGDGTDLDVLRKAEVGGSDLLVACATSDEMNIISCIYAKKLGCKNTIARVRTPGLSKQIYFIKEDLNLSTTINPELAAAREIFGMLELPGVIHRESFANERVEIVGIAVKEGSVLNGLSLIDLPKKLKVKALVGAVGRGDQVYIPKGNFTLLAGDKVYLCAPATQVVNILHKIGDYSGRVSRVAIIGASRITQYLTQMLLRTGTKVLLIEAKKEKAEAFAEEHPEVTVVCADGTSGAVLRSERVDKMDSVVTLTNIDEENLILSMYLHNIGVRQVITKVNHIEYAGMFENNGVDHVVSPKKLSANEIVRYVRAMQNSEGSNVVTLHRLLNGSVEALEFRVTSSTKNRGKLLKDMKLRENVLIASINRNGKIIIPGGVDTIERGDTVVVVTTSKKAILDLDDIFIDGD